MDSSKEQAVKQAKSLTSLARQLESLARQLEDTVKLWCVNRQ